MRSGMGGGGGGTGEADRMGTVKLKIFQKKMLLQIKSPVSSGDESEIATKPFKKKTVPSR